MLIVSFSFASTKILPSLRAFSIFCCNRPLAGSDRGGQLDTIASRAAIAGEAAALATKRNAPHLSDSVGTDVKKITSTALADAIQRGDEDVEELVRNRARILGIILSNMVDFLNPQMIVLGGGLVDAMPDIITQEVTAGIKSHATPEAQ
jgi:glucokinase